MKRFSTLHIANTEFELELMQNKKMKPFSFHHPISIQLQCLPFLFAGPEDGIVVKGQVPSDYMKHLEDLGLSDLSGRVCSPGDQIECETVRSWGMSRSIAAFAEEKGLPYPMPDWEVVREVNSKIFSFNQLPNFENSRIIESSRELKAWVKGLKGKGVLKTAFGFSGRGKVIVDQDTAIERLLRFCEKEWKKNRPVIGGPWLSKELDFSSHWTVGREKIEFLGITRVMNDRFGAYRGSVVGPDVEVPFADEHFTVAKKALKAMRQKGYFGPVGIDAMIYGGDKLHPLVEINARMTMSQVGILFRQKFFPEKTLQFDFSDAGQDNNYLLPKKIINPDESEIKFNKQLYFKFYT